MASAACRASRFTESPDNFRSPYPSAFEMSACKVSVDCTVPRCTPGAGIHLLAEASKSPCACQINGNSRRAKRPCQHGKLRLYFWATPAMHTMLAMNHASRPQAGTCPEVGSSSSGPAPSSFCMIEMSSISKHCCLNSTAAWDKQNDQYPSMGCYASQLTGFTRVAGLTFMHESSKHQSKCRPQHAEWKHACYGSRAH